MDKTIYIFAADSTTDNEFNYILQEDASLPSREIEQIRIVRGTSVSEIANLIITRLGRDGSNRIKKLIILSHGNSGHAFIGAGITTSNCGNLAPLNGYFATPNTGIFFHGCRIASGINDHNPRNIHRLDAATCRSVDESMGEFTMDMMGTWREEVSRPESRATIGNNGYIFMRTLAAAVRVDVTAARDRQVSITERRGRRLIDLSGYEGSYVTVHPDGTHTGLLSGVAFSRVWRTYCGSDE